MKCLKRKMSSGEDRPLIRNCTDVPWLVTFILLWLWMVGIAIFSYVYGRPLSIINGYDSFGNICGVGRNEKYLAFPLSGLNMTERRLLFYFDNNNTDDTIRICVNRCPDINISTPLQLHRYHTDLNTNLCRYDYNGSLLIDMKTSNAKYFHRLGPCPPMNIVETVPLQQICLPKCEDMHASCYQKLGDSRFFTQLFLSDLYTKWHYLAAIVLLATGLSFSTAVSIHVFPKKISCLVCFLYFIAGITFVSISLFVYFNGQRKGDGFRFVFVQNCILLTLSVLAAITTIIAVITSYRFWSKMGKVAKLFKEASQCLLSLPSVLLLPLLAFVMLLALLIFELSVIMHLASSSYPRVRSYSLQSDNGEHTALSSNGDIYHNSSTDNYKTFNHIEHVEVHWLRTMVWLHIIGYIWTAEFISACLQLTIAGTVAHWYFNKSKKSSVAYMLAKLIKYHLGSAVKGALLINIFKPFRIILASLYMRLKIGERNGCRYASYGVKGCCCCFWLMEKFIRYLNHNAYVVIAIESINFFPAAEVAWNTTYLLESSSRERSLSQTADLIIFLAKLLITTVSAIVGVVIFYSALDVYLNSLLLIVSISSAYAVAHLFLTTYEIVIDTLSLCASESKVIKTYATRWGQGYPGHVFEEQLSANVEPLTPLFEMTPTKNNN